MVTIILFAPLLGAVLCGFGYRWLGEKAAIWIADRAAVPRLPAVLDRLLQLRRRDGEPPVFPLDRLGDAGGGLGLPARPADGDHAGGGDDGVVARAPLQLRLHGPRRELPRGRELQAAVLRLPVVLHLRHAGAGHRRQPPAALLRLGGGGRRLLPADRLLLPQAERRRRGDQGLRRQPGRRLRLPARDLHALRAGRLDRPHRHLRRRPGDGRDADHLPLAGVERRRGGLGAARSSAPWASRRSSSCTPGCRTRWRARRRSPR